MDRIIRKITEHYVSRLPAGEEQYRIKNLASYDFPPFLVRRIHIELQWNLDESMMLPETDWANTQSQMVQQSWQTFLNAIHAEVQIPASYARAVIETAVADILEMLVQPRKNITNILFGGEKILPAAELRERAELLVVYSHFARVLASYMERKNKDELTRKKCKEIIKRVDEKVTNQYTPLQWAQMLDPLFTLAGPQVETDLFRLFFEDRNMLRTARNFDMMATQITRAVFIEVLSSPELLNYDGYEEDQSELFNEERAEKQVQTPPPALSPAEELPIENEAETETGQAEAQKEETKEEDLLSSEAVNEKEDDAEASPIVPQPDFEITPEHKSNEPEKDEPAPLNAIFSDEKDTPQQLPEDVSLEVAPNEGAPEDEESPIWQRFMDPAEAENEQRPETSPSVVEAEQTDDPQSELLLLLAHDEDYFINELFDGSKPNYKKSLHEIAQQTSWKEASKLIRQNIFERNDVNIYSAAAVDFTDRLQSYFVDKKNRN